MSQKIQKEVLDKFREGEYNILVATSIGEEGLDIPKVDTVIFYEPVSSAIRQIQRRGRTGRMEKGKVVILMAKETRDEGYRWASHHKEKRMFRTLDSLKEKLGQLLGKPKEERLDKFINEEILIYADHREKGSGVIKELANLEVDIRLDQLKNADYVLSNRVGVEFKNTADFVQSIIDGRLLLQIKDLKVNFERPLIVIEGQEDLYSLRNVHENAIRGMLATIAVSYGIPVLRTKNAKDTAGLLMVIAKREQETSGKDFTPHGEKRDMTLKQWQEFIVSSFPGIGGSLAKPLLKKFKTIKKFVNAKEETLQKVDKIGPTKARRIKEVLEKEYGGEK
jgi:Fanconi anemia group M protein